MPDVLSTSNLSDEELIAETIKGSVTSFEAIVYRYESKLLHFISMKIRNRHDAEDLLQNTFVKAYCKISTFDLNKRFSTWLYTIAYNELVSFTRKRKFEALPHDFEQEDTINSNQSIWNDLKVILPSKDYLLLWLHYGEGYSIVEVGEIIGKKESAVKTGLHRLRKKIPALLEADENQGISEKEVL